MPSMDKLLLKGEFGVCALNSHGNYIVDHGKSWKNHGIAFLNFCGNPVIVPHSSLTDEGGSFSGLSLTFLASSFQGKVEQDF